LLIRLLENELSEEEAKHVRQQLRTDTAWQNEWLRLKRAQLEPDENKTYPWKEQLKRHKQPVIGYKRLSMISSGAAALLFLMLWYGGMGLKDSASFQQAKTGAAETAQPASYVELEKLNTAKATLKKSLASIQPDRAKVAEMPRKTTLPALNKPDSAPANIAASLQVVPPLPMRATLISAEPDKKRLKKAAKVPFKAATMDLPLKAGAQKATVEQGPDKESNDLIKQLAVKVLNLEKHPAADTNSSLYAFEFKTRAFRVNGKINLD